MNVLGTVMTSSPGPMPPAKSDSQRASVPLPTPIACWQSQYDANSCSNFSTNGPPAKALESITLRMTRLNSSLRLAVKLITETRVMRFQVEEWHSNVHLFWGQVFTTGATEPSTARFGGRPNATGVALSAIN